MAFSSSNSTSKKQISASSASKQKFSADSRMKNPFQRSKSLRAVRSYTKSPAASSTCGASVAQFLNKRDNPLFCTSTPSSPEHERGDDGCNNRRGRPVSRSIGCEIQTFESRNQSTRSLSRVGSEGRLQSISREQCDYSEHDHPLACGDVGFICETICLEVQRAISEIKNDIENAIWRENFTLHSTDGIAKMCPDLVYQDALNLVSDIRMEYETKLKESHEHARKLRADLAFEEHREKEISRMLNEIIPDYNSARMSWPRKKAQLEKSIERLEMSRRLAENALSYFDECVSISTFDGLEFSLTEGQRTGSVSAIPLFDGSFNNQEQVEIQTQCTGSYLSSVSSCDSSEDPSTPFNDKKHSKLPKFESFKNSSEFEAASSGECHDFRTYIKMFEKQPNQCTKNGEVNSNFNINDYDLDSSAESLLLDIVLLKNRIESGSLLLCDIRTF